jgi:quercetin dioxygenase-like cupin family protein
MKAIRIAGAMALAGGGLALAALAQQPGVRRTQLQRHDLSEPGREMIQVRVELDAGVAFPRHRHPGMSPCAVMKMMGMSSR